MSDIRDRLAANLAEVRACIDAAARRSQRTAGDITLVAVTKYVDASVATALADLGCPDLGESRPQELWHKVPACQHPAVRWHLVGHLQRNKVTRTLPLVALIHSVDSLRLLEEIDRQSGIQRRRTPILLEVNISGDITKHGFRPTEMAEAVRAAVQCPNLELRGLMTMASREGDLTVARSDFRRLRELRDQLCQVPNAGLLLPDLSMGMSADFEVAIEEGATIVRVGSRLFEGVSGPS